MKLFNFVYIDGQVFVPVTTAEFRNYDICALVCHIFDVASAIEGEWITELGYFLLKRRFACQAASI